MSLTIWLLLVVAMSYIYGMNVSSIYHNKSYRTNVTPSGHIEYAKTVGTWGTNFALIRYMVYNLAPSM